MPLNPAGEASDPSDAKTRASRGLAGSRTSPAKSNVWGSVRLWRGRDKMMHSTTEVKRQTVYCECMSWMARDGLVVSSVQLPLA